MWALQSCKPLCGDAVVFHVYECRRRLKRAGADSGKRTSGNLGGKNGSAELLRITIKTGLEVISNVYMLGSVSPQQELQ